MLLFFFIHFLFLTTTTIAKTYSNTIKHVKLGRGSSDTTSDVKREFKESFSLLTKMLGLAWNAFSPNLKFLVRLSVFKILQFKISRFPLTLVFPFYQYCDKRLTLGNLAYVYWKAASWFYCFKPVLCFTITLPQNIYGESRTCSQLLKFCF